MFKFLTPTPYTSSAAALTARKSAPCGRQKSTVVTGMLTAILLLSACQQQAETDIMDKGGQTVEQQYANANKSAVQSDEAATRIAEFQPLYVTQMQGLQRRLQAEYESLQAADTSDSESVSGNNAQSTNDSSQATATNQAKPKDETVATSLDINTSTEVGERDLKVLKSLSLEVYEPQLLPEDELIKRYQQAMEALYQPTATALSAQDIDTLLNIVTLTPQLFEHPEIAARLTLKSPALGRLIVQYQVWQQIEVQQALDMQQLKQTQQQEFETLMTKFDDTIKGYDEQIAKYEQTLKEFK
ncbi:hypothetical protein [Psychrobacter sp. GP33]|uniref:hypothetical protein n=1 Tax=Psychrobacter sp. GP33 TaxID=2758709 RepID=UPI0015F9393A|nr:hypothetical protein [Psychrobacter sp. GP33]